MIMGPIKQEPYQTPEHGPIGPAKKKRPLASRVHIFLLSTALAVGVVVIALWIMDALLSY